MYLHPYDLLDYIGCPEKYKRKLKGNSTAISNRLNKSRATKISRVKLSKNLIKEYFNQIHQGKTLIDINLLWHEFKENSKAEFNGEDLLWIIDKINSLPQLVPQATSILDVDFPIHYTVEGVTFKFKVDALYINDRHSHIRPVVIWDYNEAAYHKDNYTTKYFGQLVSEAFKKEVGASYPSKKISKGYIIRPDVWKIAPFNINMKDKSHIASIVKSMKAKNYYPVPNYKNCSVCPFNVKGGCLWKYTS